VRVREGFGDLDYLATRLLGAEVDCRADCDRAHVARLLNRAEEDLVELVRVGEKLVMIDLYDEGNLVRVLARDDAEHAERRGDGVAAAFYRKLDDVLRVEVDRVRRKRRARRMLDALIDGQNREIARARESPCVEERLKRTQDARASVGVRPH